MKGNVIFGLVVSSFVLMGCEKIKSWKDQMMAPGKEIVEMQTNKGKIVIELDAAKAPKTVSNFLEYVDSGFYNGTVFHRVIDGFMVQGGGFDQQMVQKPTKEPISNEASNGLSNKPMTIAMARTQDPNSATAQFFINLVDNARLDYTNASNPGYAVFGKVIEGEEVVRSIGKSKTTTKGFYADVPAEAVVIENVIRRK